MIEEYHINTCNICHIVWNILDVLHYSVSTPFYFFDYKVISCDAPKALECYPQGDTSIYNTSFASKGLIGVIYAMAPNKKKGVSG